MTKTRRFASTNFSVYTDTFVISENGERKVIDYVDQPPVAIAVPILEDGRVVLVEHIRPLLGAVLLECPGGKVAPHEAIEDAVRREIDEEIGYSTMRLERLGSFYTSVGTSTEMIHAFVATGLRRTSGVPQATGDVGRMTVVYKSPAEIRSAVVPGIMLDGKSHVALVAALNQGYL